MNVWCIFDSHSKHPEWARPKLFLQWRCCAVTADPCGCEPGHDFLECFRFSREPLVSIVGTADDWCAKRCGEHFIQTIYRPPPELRGTSESTGSIAKSRYINALYQLSSGIRTSRFYLDPSLHQPTDFLLTLPVSLYFISRSGFPTVLIRRSGSSQANPH